MKKEVKELRTLLDATGLPYEFKSAKHSHHKVYVDGRLLGTFTTGKDGTIYNIMKRLRKLQRA